MENFYAMSLIVSSVIALVTMGIILGRRKEEGAYPLAVFMGAISFWAITYAFFWLSDSPQWKYLWLNITYFGVVAAPGAFFLFTMCFTRREHFRLTPLVVFLFMIEPIITLILVWSDPLNHWFFAGKRTPESTRFYDGGGLFWLNVTYSYILLLVSTILLIQKALHLANYYRRQLVFIITGLAFPWIVNILSMAELTPWSGLDATPIASTVTGITVLYSLLNWGFLSLVPIAHELLIQNLKDGVLVVERSGRIVYFNQACQDLLAGAGKLKVGASVDSLLDFWPPAARQLILGGKGDAEVFLDQQPPVYLELHNSPILDHSGLHLGQLITWYDITARKLVENALQETNAELNARVNEIEDLQVKLSEQAIRDSLTGAYNRRYMDETLERELARSARTETPLAVVVLDFDSFKQVNDLYGHQVGDRVLQQTTDLLSQNIRSSDILCRYGGEEFVIILPGIGAAAAIERAETWRQAIENNLISSSKGSFCVTVSIGIAIFPMHAAHAEELINAADKAMYRAKRAGRNRVMLFDFSPVG